MKLSCGQNEYSEPFDTTLCTFLNVEVETIFWDSNTMHWKMFNSKLSHRELFRNLFRSYPKVKNKCSESLKIAFFIFFPNFWVTKLKPFFGKVKQSIENYLNPNLWIRKHFKKWVWSCFEDKNKYFESFEITFFLILQIFEWLNWNRFLGK